MTDLTILRRIVLPGAALLAVLTCGGALIDARYGTALVASPWMRGGAFGFCVGATALRSCVARARLPAAAALSHLMAARRVTLGAAVLLAVIATALHMIVTLPSGTPAAPHMGAILTTTALQAMAAWILLRQIGCRRSDMLHSLARASAGRPALP